MLRHWMPCDIVGERRAGAKLELPFWPENVEGYHLEDDPVLYGEIEVWDPPRRFDWTWDGDRLSFAAGDFRLDVSRYPFAQNVEKTFRSGSGIADRLSVQIKCDVHAFLPTALSTSSAVIGIFANKPPTACSTAAA